MLRVSFARSPLKRTPRSATEQEFFVLSAGTIDPALENVGEASKVLLDRGDDSLERPAAGANGGREVIYRTSRSALATTIGRQRLASFPKDAIQALFRVRISLELLGATPISICDGTSRMRAFDTISSLAICRR